MSELQMFLHHLRQPEYVHVLLNPLPIYGVAAGCFVLVVSMLRRNAKEQFASLIWLALMGAVTWVVIRYGQRGYDRVYAMSNQEAQQWLDVHMHRAETFQWAFYALGLFSLMALLTKRHWPGGSHILVWLALVTSIVCVGLGGWISQAGGQIRHSEFREGPPSPKQMPPDFEMHHHSP